jgi:Mn2+/Fe2+ NRAMP family transporter
MLQRMNLRKLWIGLGPGILLAATSVGASHLVHSPRAGALFGYQLLWLIVASHLFKYPAFEFGPRYAAATGHHLLDGYARIPGPKHWALFVFLISTLAQGIGVLAGVVSVAGCVLWTWTQVLSVEWFSVILVALILVLLFAGGFSWLDHLNKIMMAILALATLMAFVPMIPGPLALGPAIQGPEAVRGLVIPTIPYGSVIMIAAILGWMPTGIDVSVWHSFWTIEKNLAAGPDAEPSVARRVERLKTSLWDMRIGYAFSLATGLMFVIMGAVHLTGQGDSLKDVQFVAALSTAYTEIFGRWMYHVFMLTAFFAMFSTSYTVIDGFSRSFSECCAVLWPAMSATGIRKRIYAAFAIASSVLACIILVRVGNPVKLVVAVSLISLSAAPLLYGFNLYCVTRHINQPELRPWTLTVGTGFAGIVFMVIALGTTAYVTLSPAVFAWLGGK